MPKESKNSFKKLKRTKKMLKESKTRNATRCNNRDDMFHLNFILKLSIF